jgi:hypothetical protein
MRFPFALVTSLSLVACGGSTSNPETAAASADASASATAATTAAASGDQAPSAAPASSASAEPGRAPATLAGAIDGKPFHGVAACVIGQGKAPGKVYIEIYDVKDFDVKKTCGRLPAVPDARKIGVLLPWSAGAKLDVATIKASEDPDMFVMATTANPKKFDRKDVGKEIKPTGTIQVLNAPVQKGAVGRIKLDLTTGGDKLTGEIDVDVMADGLH